MPNQNQVTVKYLHNRSQNSGILGGVSGWLGSLSSRENAKDTALNQQVRDSVDSLGADGSVEEALSDLSDSMFKDVTDSRYATETKKVTTFKDAYNLANEIMPADKNRNFGKYDSFYWKVERPLANLSRLTPGDYSYRKALINVQVGAREYLESHVALLGAGRSRISFARSVSDMSKMVMYAHDFKASNSEADIDIDKAKANELEKTAAKTAERERSAEASKGKVALTKDIRQAYVRYIKDANISDKLKNNCLREAEHATEFVLSNKTSIKDKAAASKAINAKNSIGREASRTFNVLKMPTLSCESRIICEFNKALAQAEYNDLKATFAEAEKFLGKTAAANDMQLDKQAANEANIREQSSAADDMSMML